MCSVPLETGMPRALTFAIVFCISGLRWSAYSFCALQLRVALVCVVFLCFATQGCAGLRILFVLCNSGLRWPVFSFCVAVQGCDGLRHLFPFCISGLRWSTYSFCGLQLTGWCWSAFSFCVLQLRVTLVCVFFLCAATQGHAGLRSFFACCKSGLRWSAYSHCFASQGRAGLRTYYNVSRKLVITAFNSVILIIWQL